MEGSWRAREGKCLPCLELTSAHTVFVFEYQQSASLKAASIYTMMLTHFVFSLTNLLKTVPACLSTHMNTSRYIRITPYQTLLTVGNANR